MNAMMAVLLIAGVFVGVAALLAVAWAVREWRRFGGTRVVTCPETGRPAAVKIDSRRAAMTALSPSGESVHLADCSRWETRGRCDDACLEEAVGPDSRATEIAARWYAGRRCVYCGKPVHDEAFVAHRVAVRGPDRLTREWSDIAADQLPDAFSAGEAVCWDCHVAETFRRQYPELVTDRG
jgi:hypothetical protein